MKQAKLQVLLLCSGVYVVAAESPTFHKDVEPLLQKHCQGCHRPGEIGPMPFLTFQQVRPWAAAIKSSVVTKKMPPWFADRDTPHKFNGDLSLSEKEVEVFRKWADKGAPRGNEKDAPPEKKFVAGGWSLGTPDKIVEMPQPYVVPENGTVEYTYVIVPSGFTEDKWVKAAEILPGNRAVVHHIITFVRNPGSKWLAKYPKGVPFVPDPLPGRERRGSDGDREGEGSLADEWLVGYAPGQKTWTVPEDTAFLVKAGSDFIFQLHYTTNGKSTTDQSKVGLFFAERPPKYRALVYPMANAGFAIPPGEGNYAVHAEQLLKMDSRLIATLPHMHLRGKAMSVEAIHADGKAEKLINVPKYDFNWQQLYTYQDPVVLKKGSELRMTAVFDNSANNPHNPDPSATVRWGDQTDDEMALMIMIWQIDPSLDIEHLLEGKKKKEEKKAEE